MELSTEESKRLKEIEIDIFENFINVCSELNLRYYIIAGTLIGAIRHHGFIPWDDDIDVAMPRDDFEIFLEKAKYKLPEYLFLQTNGTDSEYALNYAKLRNSNTTFLEETNRNLKINSGIFIDIFPLDNYINSISFNLIASAHIKIYKTAIGRVFYRRNISPSLKVKQAISGILFPNPYQALRAMDRFTKSIKYTGYCNNFSSNYGLKEACPWEWFGNGVDVEFEGLKVKAPDKYDEYLRHIYGNYMDLPPKEKQKSYHTTDFIDLDKACWRIR